jgi:hypothetical protein
LVKFPGMERSSASPRPVAEDGPLPNAPRAQPSTATARRNPTAHHSQRRPTHPPPFPQASLAVIARPPERRGQSLTEGDASAAIATPIAMTRRIDQCDLRPKIIRAADTNGMGGHPLDCRSGGALRIHAPHQRDRCRPRPLGARPGARRPNRPTCSDTRHPGPSPSTGNPVFMGGSPRKNTLRFSTILISSRVLFTHTRVESH